MEPAVVWASVVVVCFLVVVDIEQAYDNWLVADFVVDSVGFSTCHSGLGIIFAIETLISMV